MAYIKKEWKVSTFQKGDKEFVDGLNHMEEGIEQGGGGGGEPAEYLKNAAVAGEKLTITKKDGSTVEFDVSGKANRVALEEEVSARQLGDQTLQNNINLKQDIISDLTAIRNGASLGLTAVQPEAISDMATKTEVAQTYATKSVLAEEVLARAEADDTLEAGINSEAVTRGNADNALSIRISNLEARGRFLSSWNATTGKPETEPETKPYTYKSGDYYIVSAVGATNYKPTGFEYTGEASTAVESAEVAVNDFYNYDGTNWILVKNTQKAVTFAQVTGEPRSNLELKQEFETIEQTEAAIQASKQDVITDLETIRAGAALGATAIQEHQDISGKLNVLPKVDDPSDPGFGWEYHIPYRFDFSTDTEKLNVKLHTLTLDNKLTKMQFDSSVPSATSTNAGLMSAADKALVDTISSKAELPSELPPELKVPGVDHPWFMINMNPKSIDAQGQLHLDHSGYNFNTKQYYTWADKVIPLAATEATGGFMTAADKVKLNAAITEHQDISGKLDKPTEPIAGQGLNVPYYFDVNYAADKVTVNDYTVDLLDKSKAPQQFSLDINTATESTAGLMSAADKIAVDEMLPAYPTDTTSEYVLGLKYENGAWKKYWKETINRSDVVDSGMVDYMVLKS